MIDGVFMETRDSVHAVCEHVLAAARYEAVGRIGLSVVAGGFATPPFGENDRQVGLIGDVLTVQDTDGERRQAVTTLREAGEFVGITPGAPSEVYPPNTECDLEAPLVLDPTQIRALADWYSLIADALRTFSAHVAADEPSETTLWPEHFDVAVRAAEVNYGGLAGDDTVVEPYVYVGPGPEVLAVGDPFWNTSFGAIRTWSEITSPEDALGFFLEGHRRTAA
jgi:hypothetical protein